MLAFWMQGSIILHFLKFLVNASNARQSKWLDGGTSDPISPSAGTPRYDLLAEKVRCAGKWAGVTALVLPGTEWDIKTEPKSPLAQGCALLSTFAHFSGFWGIFSNIWILLRCTQEQRFPLLCAPCPSPTAVPHAGPVAVIRENNLLDHPQSIILWYWVNVITNYVMGNTWI